MRRRRCIASVSISSAIGRSSPLSSTSPCTGSRNSRSFAWCACNTVCDTAHVRVAAVVCVLAFASTARAQPTTDDAGSDAGSAAAPAPPPPPAPTTGTIEGTVEAPDLDAPLAGATVTLVGTTTTAITDDAGHYAIEAPPGVQKLRADFTGFKSEERVVSVTVGAAAKLDFALATAQLLNETIVAVGSRPPRPTAERTVPVA